MAKGIKSIYREEVGVINERIEEQETSYESIMLKAENSEYSKKKARRNYEREMGEQYKKAVEYLERNGKKSNTLEYFFNCGKVVIASEYFGYKDVALEMGRFIADSYYYHTVYNEAKEKGCEIQYIEVCRECLDICARYGDFDSFCLAMEFYRKPKNAFYYPRREVLKRLHIIQDLQDLADGKLDLLAISMPQRTGKSRIGLFFITFYMLLNIDKELQTFGVGHSAGLVESFYNEILMYLRDSQTYRVFEIFPNHKVVGTSKDYYTISLDRQKGMPDLAFRSIDGTITGAVEGGLLMYADDLIKDQSEVINTELANKIWSKFNTLVLGRMKQNVPLLYMGTMWGQNCPISRLREYYSEDNMSKLGLKMRCRFNAISCYNENGESQFNYLFDKGFDTQYYKKIQLTLERADRALWYAMYLAKPISRLGRPFEEISFYEKLPNEPYDYSVSAIDVATSKGGDNWACPLCLVYENRKEIYVDEVVYNNKGVDVTIPKTVEMFLRRKPIQCEIEEKESTQGKIWTGIGAKINELLQKRGMRIRIHSHSGAGLKSKRERIMKYRTDILGIETEFGYTVYFNEKRYKTDSEYTNFCDDIKNWSEDDSAQKKQKDDSIDSIAQVLEYCVQSQKTRVNTSISLKDLGL